MEHQSIIVTSAGRSGSDERQARMRRYLYTQGVRALCFVLAVSLPVPLWARLVLIVGALVLPWMGVMAANAAPSREADDRPNAMVDHVDEPVRIQIESHRVIDQD